MGRGGSGVGVEVSNSLALWEQRREQEIAHALAAETEENQCAAPLISEPDNSQRGFLLKVRYRDYSAGRIEIYDEFVTMRLIALGNYPTVIYLVQALWQQCRQQERSSRGKQAGGLP